MAKKGGNPQNLKYQGAKKYAAQALAVRVDTELDAFVRSLPNKNEWLRQAIAEKYQREQLSSEQQPA